MPGPRPLSVSHPRSILWDNEKISVLSSLFEEVHQPLRLFRFEVFFAPSNHKQY